MRHKLSVTALHTRGKQNIKEPEGSREGGALGPWGGRKEAPCWPLAGRNPGDFEATCSGVCDLKTLLSNVWEHLHCSLKQLHGWLLRGGQDKHGSSTQGQQSTAGGES